MNKKDIWILLGGTALALCSPRAWAGEVATQDAPAQPTAGSLVHATASNKSGTAPAQDAGSLGEIVVTAQRREERLQDVPIAITAVTGKGLADAHVSNITMIQSLSPSIQFRAQANGASSANVIIRGLGTTGTARAFEGAVGVFVDGVYRTRAAAVMQDFLDFDSLQVLRGPQGTLFGKNTSAGAVLMTSTAPSFETRVDGELSVGNYGTVSAKAAIGTGLSDSVAIRVAALHSSTHGFYTDPNDGRHIADNQSNAVKAQLLWEPGDRVSFHLIGDYSKSNGHCCFTTSSYLPGPAQALINGLILARGLKLPSTNPGDFEQVLSNPGQQQVEDYGATLLGSVAFGGDTLKTVTAIRKFRIAQSDGDADFSGADILNLDERFASRFLSQEVSFNGHSERLRANYVIGAFLSDEQIDIGRNLRWGSQAQAFWNAALGAPGRVYAAPGLWAQEAMRGSNQSYALFAHSDFDLARGWNLIAGARYSIEDKRGSFRNSFYRSQSNDTFRVLGLMPAPAYDAATTDRALSGTLGVQYRLGPDAMIYLSYNRGFKAGGIILDANGAGGVSNNPAITPGAKPLSPAYRPEKVNGVEWGAKVTYLDRKARTNIAIFYNDVSDLQAAQFIGVQFTVLNAKSARTYGLELENSFKLSPALSLDLNGTWLPYAKYGVDPALSAVLSGSRIRFVPKFGGNAALKLDAPMNDRVSLIGRAELQYTSPEFLDNSSLAQRSAVTLVNLDLGFKTADGRWQIEGWVQNLTNRIYANTAFLVPLQGTTENVYLAPPRTFGARLRVHL